jgi:YHS domain-containing protein
VIVLRFIVLAILLYIGYRLIAANFKSKKADEEPEHSGEPGRITDVLVECPCGRLVPRQQAYELDRDGEIRYFCSETCRNEFESTAEDKQ